MQSYLFASGIRFNDCFFSEPVLLTDWVPPQFPGLFVLLACDSSWAPRSFRPLCFGEFGNHAKYPIEDAGYGWLVGGQSRKALFAAVFPMHFSTTTQRGALRDELVSGYHPVFQANGARATASDLSQRLEQMEKRHQDHAAQMLMLLGNIHKHFEPLPVPQRRHFGFLPESAPSPGY